MSRSRTVERRKQREQEQRRQRQIIIVVAVAVVAIVAVALVILANQPAEAAIAAESVERYVGLPQSKTVEGFPMLGNPDAPVKVEELSSFDCPHCREFYDDVTPAMIDRVRAGEISFTYIPLYGTGGIPNGLGAARAALCAGEQDSFWPYHSALFTWQGLYGNQALAGNRLAAGIDNLDINRAEWDSCMSSNRPDQILDAASTKTASISGFAGTPSVLVNGTLVSPSLSAVNTAIDQALASAPPVQPIGEATEEATQEATTEAVTEATEEAVQEATTEATTEASS
jgi:protein-disulfide isomerase